MFIIYSLFIIKVLTGESKIGDISKVANVPVENAKTELDSAVEEIPQTVEPNNKMKSSQDPKTNNKMDPKTKKTKDNKVVNESIVTKGQHIFFISRAC